MTSDYQITREIPDPYSGSGLAIEFLGPDLNV